MIVLASRSPRRKELLDRIGVAYEVEPADIDERREPGELPETFAVRLAREKAATVARRRRDVWVLAADTVVVLGDELLGKPASQSAARRMLERLSGREHRVVTAVAVARGSEIYERCDVTRVWFRSLDPALISDYVATGEPLDKAGSYGLQGRGAVLVERIEGDYFGVIGLPVRLVVELLETAGIPYAFTR
jgi:septum formation protein